MKSEMKTCTKCGDTFPAAAEYFYKDLSGKNGLIAQCKECKKEQQKEYKLKHPEQCRKAVNRWREENPDKQRESIKRWHDKNPEWGKLNYATNREKINKQRRELRRQNPERNRQYQRQYLLNNPDFAEKKRKQSSNYYYTNREKRRNWRQLYRQQPHVKDRRREYMSRWQKRNADRVRINGARREARKRELPANYSIDDWQHTLDYYNYCCAVCGNQLRDLSGGIVPHADHWIPLSSDDCPGTVATNMICLCSTCNLSKNATMPDIWLKQRFGTHKADQILARIETYFTWVEVDTCQR